MAAETNTKIPTPLYAAAAVGDLAYQRLRKLPATVADLRERVARTDLDTDRLRGLAQRNASSLVSSAKDAQVRAQNLYTKLVAHGEEVVRGRRLIHATIGAEPAPAPAAEAKATKPAVKKATKAAKES